MTSVSKIAGDPRFIQIIAIVFVILANNIAAVWVQGVPNYVTDFYNNIEKLQPGDKVLILSSNWVAGEREINTIGVAVLKRMLEKGATIIWYCGGTFAQTADMNELNIVLGSPFTNNPLYGERIVFIGYIAGAPMIYYTLADNPKQIAKTDYLGTDLNAMKATMDWNSAKDLKMAILWGVAGAEPPYATAAFKIKWGTTLLETGDGGIYSWTGQYYVSGQIIGILAGTRCGAMYEQLLGKPGLSQSFLTAMISLTWYLVAAIVVVNILYFATRKKQKPDVIAK